MRFRLVLYDTADENKYATESRHEFFGDLDAIWHLWFILTRTLGKKHVEVFSLDGTKQRPDLGSTGMGDYNI